MSENLVFQIEVQPKLPNTIKMADSLKRDDWFWLLNHQSM